MNPTTPGIDDDLRALSIATMDTAAYAAMIIDGGREINGRWHGTYTEVTCSCLDGQHDDARHGVCTGWCNPLTGMVKCVCPCHDSYRAPYNAAADAVRAAVAALEARVAAMERAACGGA